MTEVKASELMKEQQKRFLRIKQEEQEKRVPQNAKESFYRKPYMGIYGNKYADVACLNQGVKK